MSFSSPEDIQCACGHEFEAELTSIVNAQSNPEIKSQILAGEFNLVGCPQCHHVNYIERLVIYHDPAEELLAYVYPGRFGLESAFYEKKMNDDFKTAQDEMPEDERLSYSPVALFGVHELVDLLKKEEEEKLQGAILKNVSRDLPVKIVHLKPSLARHQGLPQWVPFSRETKHDRESLSMGIAEALKTGQGLSVYQDLLKKLTSHPKWTPRFR